MRVITGLARGRRLETVDGLDVRPTADRVKQAIFSSLQFDIEGRRILDLFAGCGQMGIEALSRGAKSCTFVDSSARSADVVRQNLESTGLLDRAVVANVRAEDFLRDASMSCEQFDIAFLDPPFDRGLMSEVLPLILPCMSEYGRVVCEHSIHEEVPGGFGEFSAVKNVRYGSTAVTYYFRGTD